MVHDPEFERKHPRDPADGQFVDTPGSAWAQRISDSIDQVFDQPKLPDFPPDGMRMQAREVGARADRWGGGGTGFSGLEFWDPINELWRNGSEAEADSGGGLSFHDLGGLRRDAQFTPSAPIYVRRLPAGDGTTVDPASERPDPNREYLFDDDRSLYGLLDPFGPFWIPGDRIVVDTEHPVYNQARDLVPEWRVEAPNHAYTGVQFDPDRIVSRPRVHPNLHFDSRPMSPDDRRRSFDAAKVIRAVDLLEHPQFLNGYYQVWHGGAWHTIEEVYQDDPDEEVMELIADGLHLPALDTSDELEVRRTPLDY